MRWQWQHSMYSFLVCQTYMGTLPLISSLVLIFSGKLHSRQREKGLASVSKSNSLQICSICVSGLPEYSKVDLTVPLVTRRLFRIWVSLVNMIRFSFKAMLTNSESVVPRNGTVSYPSNLKSLTSLPAFWSMINLGLSIWTTHLELVKLSRCCSECIIIPLTCLHSQ